MAMMQQVVYQSGAVDQGDQFQILDKVDSGKAMNFYDTTEISFYFALALYGMVYLYRDVS